MKKEHFFSVSIRNSPDFLDIRPFTTNGWKSRVLYTYYINLNDKLESHADHLVKKNIRKAERNHIMIEPFSDVSRYYDLLCETYSRKNMNPPCSKNLIVDLYNFIQNQNCGEMVAAKTPDEEIASAEIVVWDTRQAYAWSAVSDSRFNNSGSPSFLRFDDLKRMQARGIPKMNMMTGNIPELSQFTAHLNPTLVPYYEIQNRMIDQILPRNS
jgi:lipid II:glycine glycyltransferase (peptidoglycan interpeptide bridge formation enzyme)